MADKRLNVERIRQAMDESGLNASAVATALNVSKTIVSAWLKGNKFPRPRLLLDFGKLLGLGFEETVIRDTVGEPIIAFRKHGHAKLRIEDEERARSLGRAVELLVPYLPFKRLSAPARFIDPKNDAAYIEEAATEARRCMRLPGYGIGFEDIISLFADLKAVLIPVLWGERASLDNAIHVYLPLSQTSWIYLNLDTKLFDFKFWMLHELAHAQTFGLLERIDAERFADAFAAAVLVPEELAKEEYDGLVRISGMGGRITRIRKIARELVLSPVTLAKRIDSVAAAHAEPAIIGNAIYAATANFNKEFGLVSAQLFGREKPAAGELIHASNEVFRSPIYPALRAFLTERKAAEGMVAACLGLNPADAKEVYRALSDA